ncbi:MAG: DUF1847 domain-containing protein [Methanocellales archaeon]|nr:DUF1847 domain-containing protein [Methanocellales archaeon]MDD3291240.1 DUF1847 domain-containing protein [Methanocellales archaeon]MDD5235412.1 DUF1847 domain-containing protein [Methanocellales archaeon]MDD5484505.1 DUF1847 domain-containing protein [Methanocellales archaeon]
MKCALCDDKECYLGKDCTALKEKVVRKYEVENKKSEIMTIAANLEARYYMKLTRLEELITFCKEMGYQTLGIAFCIGLESEARVLHELLEKDFEVYSVCCKVCGIGKENFGLEKIKDDRYEAMCNPIGQAMVLNEKDTDLNIICGLCLGHDILFSKNSEAPVTTFIVKDRILAHNPAGAIYSKYYQRKFRMKK